MKRPYKIYEIKNPKIKSIIDMYPDFFVYTQNKNEVDCYIKRYDPTTEPNLKPEPKTIYILNIDHKIFPRKNIRRADIVDQHYFNNVTFDGIIFNMGLDLMGENIISKLGSHMPCDKISKNKDYFKEIGNEEFKFYNKCFWRGGNTHITRTKVIDFLNSKDDSRFDISLWKPTTGYTYKHNEPRPEEWEYDEYFKNMSISDIGLCIRGDRPWMYSFFDVVRAAAIPLCINTQYPNLGWEHIGYNTSDLFLSYDLTKGDTLEDVYNGIDNLLKNEEKCLEMKKNLRKFYKEIYLTDRTHSFEQTPKQFLGYGDFFIAKVIEIIENNFVLKDNKFFSKNALEIKEMLKL
jgi:hypothetical protein